MSEEIKPRMTLMTRIKNAFFPIREIRVIRGGNIISEADLRFALAVPDTNVQYRAFLQIIEEAEREALAGARAQVVNDRLCVNSLGMADGAALVRTKLLEAREEGLKHRRAGEP